MSTPTVTQLRPKAAMPYPEARATTDAWLAVRSKVRAALIAQARSLHPERRMGKVVIDYQHEVRKLWRYASDLTEARLLRLIDHPKGWRDIPPAINHATSDCTGDPPPKEDHHAR